MTSEDRTEAGDARARQNVIQELGWFQGVLGRGRTAMLVQRGIEMPSNLGGIVYLDFPGDDVEMTFDRYVMNLRPRASSRPVGGILKRAGIGLRDRDHVACNHLSETANSTGSTGDRL
jgi:hypothetical protein